MARFRTNESKVKKMPTLSTRMSKDGEQRGPGDQRHAQWHHAEIFTAVSVMSAYPDQFAHSQREQNQSSCDLKISHGNAERRENNLAEKDESNGYTKSGDDAEQRLMPTVLVRSACAQPEKNRHQPDDIDRDKNRNERDEKFVVEVVQHKSALYAAALLHNVRCPFN